MKQGFGVSVATATHDQEVEVLVGGGVGVSGAALYAIGDAESPGTTSIDTGYCSGSGLPCYLARRRCLRASGPQLPPTTSTRCASPWALEP